MAERVTRIRVQAFRSVPEDFALDLAEGRSVIVCGDNGTGKSTVADALELYFTGRIAFLAREGRQSSVRHIGAGDDVPTAVAVETTGSLGGEATIESAGNPEARSVGLRETFLLRGRTLAEFIEKPKAEKWKYVFEILGMGDVERFRLDLQNASSALTGEADRATELRGNATRALAPLIGADVSEESILAVFRTTCAQAGVHPPSSLEDATDPNWTRSLEERQKAIEAAARCARFLLDAAASFAAIGVRIERIMTDEHLSYTRSGAFRQAREIIGATHVTTGPYRPRINGKVERFHRTLLEEWAYVRLYGPTRSVSGRSIGGCGTTITTGPTPRWEAEVRWTSWSTRVVGTTARAGTGWPACSGSSCVQRRRKDCWGEFRGAAAWPTQRI